ncbi:MFS transporter [Phaeobacter sp. HF9A]|uniref:MFS transporter n=1 Tax=Phaeobacter sp. HF9A TaxID=2721561 RepID=UPI0014308097|nr:MFS transporter [Phaeobacter sp. HF9A]NIZ12388.1 MFS transporter [Phaeobacter sp. HF9A]
MTHPPLQRAVGFRSFVISNLSFLSAGAMLTFLSSFGQTFFISVFAGQIQQEFGLSHAGWGGLYMIGTMVSALVMVWAGALTDVFRVRRLGPIVLCGLALSCALMALNHRLWVLPLSIFLLRVFGQGMSTHLAVVAMARWFVAARGRALSLAALGVSFGQAVLPLTFVALMAVFDWRRLWLLAAVICLLGVPLLARLLSRERMPQSISAENSSTGMDNRHWTRGEALRSPLFWYMMPAILGPGAFNTAFFFHQLHFASTKGWSHLELAALFPIYTAAAVVFMLVSGWALDRWGANRLIVYSQLPMVLAFFMFAQSSSAAGLTLGILGLAISQGASSTLPNSLWAEAYGTRHIGAIKALAIAVMVLGSAIGPGITGLLIDLGINFDQQGYGIAVYFLFATAMMMIGVPQARRRLAHVQAG